MRNLPFAERLWLQTAGLLITLIPMTVALIYLDPTLHNDISIWKKSLKFHVSLTIHLITLAILASRFSKAARTPSACVSWPSHPVLCDPRDLCPGTYKPPEVPRSRGAVSTIRF